MIHKELIDQFMAARWKSSEDMRTFVKRVGVVASEDVVAMLDFLMSKKSAESEEHSMRVRAFGELASSVADKGLFEPYLRALKGSDRHIRSILVNLFLNSVDSKMLPQLCELLRSPDSGLRRTAAQILQKTADGTVFRILGEMFPESNFPGRNEAIDIAGAVVSHYSLEFFKTVLSTGSPAEKIRVIKYLGSPVFIKDHPKSVSGALKRALTDADITVLSDAITLFSQVCNEEEFFLYLGAFLYDNNPVLVKLAVEGLRYFSSERVAAALERKLHTGPNQIRLVVLDTIEQIGTAHVQKPLVKALEHRQKEVRLRAFEVLARLTKAGKIEIANSIIWLLTSSDPNVRAKALEVAASVPDKTANLWGEILTILKEEDWWVRQLLLDPLVEMAGDALISAVIPYLSDPSELKRHFALDVLKKLKPAGILDVLYPVAARDEDWWVREKAILVIGELKDSSAEKFLIDIAKKEPDFRMVAVDALRTIEAFSAASDIVNFLADEDGDVRLAALQYLDKLDEPAHAARIAPLVRDSDKTVRECASSILEGWKVNVNEKEFQKKGSLSILDRLLIGLHEAGGDDLFLLPENPPYMKKHGKTIPISKTVMTPELVQSMLTVILSAKQKEDMRDLDDVDFSYDVKSEGLRFRANIFTSRTGISAVFRTINENVRKLEELGLPPIVGTFGDFKNGLVLVGGPTGSGKSTTLASIISDIVNNSRRHVISIEDPIEVVHTPEKGLINQREVGVHARSFSQALRMTLREDPDVILVGEMRDLPTIQFAVSAAETGHLVFGTVHTVSADSTVDRLINAYPPESQDQVRSMLADSLKAVLCQYLIHHKEKPEMVLAAEIMINNSAISNLIRKGKSFQIPSVIATAKEQNMQLMDFSLMELYKQGKISAENAYLKARNKADFEELAGAAEDQSTGAPDA